eukprot:773575_1
MITSAEGDSCAMTYEDRLTDRSKSRHERRQALRMRDRESHIRAKLQLESKTASSNRSRSASDNAILRNKRCDFANRLARDESINNESQSVQSHVEDDEQPLILCWNTKLRLEEEKRYEKLKRKERAEQKKIEHKEQIKIDESNTFVLSFDIDKKDVAEYNCANILIQAFRNEDCDANEEDIIAKAYRFIKVTEEVHEDVDEDEEEEAE